MATHRNGTFNGLGTNAVMTVATTDSYDVQVKLQLPPGSQVITVIKQNNTTRYTGNAGAQGAFCTLELSAGDVINVVTSSSAAVDLPLNAIKFTVSVAERYTT